MFAEMINEKQLQSRHTWIHVKGEERGSEPRQGAMVQIPAQLQRLHEALSSPETPEEAHLKPL